MPRRAALRPHASYQQRHGCRRATFLPWAQPGDADLVAVQVDAGRRARRAALCAAADGVDFTSAGGFVFRSRLMRTAKTEADGDGKPYLILFQHLLGRFANGVTGLQMGSPLREVFFTCTTVVIAPIVFFIVPPLAMMVWLNICMSDPLALVGLSTQLVSDGSHAGHKHNAGADAWKRNSMPLVQAPLHVFLGESEYTAWQRIIVTLLVLLHVLGTFEVSRSVRQHARAGSCYRSYFSGAARPFGK